MFKRINKILSRTKMSSSVSAFHRLKPGLQTWRRRFVWSPGFSRWNFWGPAGVFLNYFGVTYVALMACLLLTSALHLTAQTVTSSDWEVTLASMPLHARTLKFNHLQSAPVILKALRKNDTVKAIIFLPGATDELYFFDRGRASFRGHAPTLLDGIRALTNKTSVRLLFRPPFLLLYCASDRLSTEISARESTMLDTLKGLPFPDPVLYLDQPWDRLSPVLQKSFGLEIEPKAKSLEGMHVYRVFLSAFGLTRLEAVEAVGLSTRSNVAITDSTMTFTSESPTGQKEPL